MWLSGEREGEESEQHSPLQEENRGRERECTLSAKTVMTSVSALFDKVLSGRKSDFRRSRDFDLARPLGTVTGHRDSDYKITLCYNVNIRHIRLLTDK